MSKHLSLSDRSLIERLLVMDYTFASIARILKHSPSTISREVKRYRVFTGRVNPSSENDCARYFSCLKNNLCKGENTATTPDASFAVIVNVLKTGFHFKP